MSEPNTELEQEAPEAVTPTVDVPEQSQDDQQAKPQNGEDRPSRRDRRAARVDTEAARREAEDYRRQLDEQRQEMARTREEMSRLQGYVAANFQQQPRENPAEKQIAELEDKASQHLANAANTKDPATAKREMAEYHKALRQAARIEARQDIEEQFGKFRQDLPDPEMAGMKVSLGGEFPWLATNQAARNAADGYIAVLRSRGKPDNLATYREACAMAARDFNLGGHQPPTNGQRGRYSGAPSGEGAGGGEQHPASINWDDHYQRLAQSAFPQDDPESAKAKWLAKIGPKFIASMRGAR